MSPILLFAAVLLVKHWVANYPLQTAYTEKGIENPPDNSWILPMMARAGIHAGLTLVCLIGFMLGGLAVSVLMMAVLVGIDFVAHVVLDRAKADPSLLGSFHVASAADFVQIEQDYKSPDISVVVAAQVKSKSNMYFWWVTGAINLAYGLVYLEMANLLG